MDSRIEWTQRTWNPFRGCSAVSPGCEHCYAARFGIRFSGPDGRYAGLVRMTKGGPEWTGKVVLVHDTLLHPLAWRTPVSVFANSMSDAFHPGLSDDDIDTVFGVMAGTSHHTFQVLTKRADRLAGWTVTPGRPDRVAAAARRALMAYGRNEKAAETLTVHWPLPNVWLGVSVENQRWADARIPHLLASPAAIRFISAEPLLGPIDLAPYLEEGAPRLGWVIVGGESGPGARPLELGWIRSIVAQGAAANVPVFVKQLGTVWARGMKADSFKGGDPDEWPAELRVRQLPGAAKLNAETPEASNEPIATNSVDSAGQ